MKTVFHTNIDGHEVVTGFSHAEGFIDPVATEAKLGETIKALPETVTMNDLKTRLVALRSQIGQLDGQYGAAVRANNAAAANAIAAQAQQLQYQAAQLEPQLIAALEAFNAKRKALWDAAAVYTSPAPGESLVPDDQAAALEAAFKAKAEGQAMIMDGTFVPDFRGRTYWVKAGGRWTRTDIALLGVDAPRGGILESALDTVQQTEVASQMEADRVAALTDEARAQEAAQAQQAAKNAVVQVQAEVTAGITDKSALTQALAEYKAKLSAVNAKYGVALV